jgi:F like protein
MNQAQRREYSTKFAAQSQRIERKFMGSIFDALEWQVNQALPIIKARGPEMAKGQIDMQVFNEKIEPVLTDLHVVAGLFFANKGLMEINKAVRLRTKAASFGFNEEWAEDIIAYFRLHLLDKAVIPVSQTTRDQILSVLEQGQREGWGYERIAAELQDPELLLWRARMIVRTETLKASDIGRKLAADKSEYETGKEWIAANDHRTRHSHRAVDGEIVAQDAKFAVSIYVKGLPVGVDMMTGPGDPTASPGNVINCRCTAALIPMRDENGKLIPKQQLVTA